MQLSKCRWFSAVAFTAVAFSVSGGAFAQSGNGAVVTPTTANSLLAKKSVPALSFKMTSVQQIAEAISRASGMPIVTNSLVAADRIDFTTIGGSLDTVLAELARVLPPSGSVRAVLLPKSLTPSKLPDGDVVVSYLTLQDTLAASAAVVAKAETTTDTTSADADTPSKPTFVPGEFEALGRRLSTEKATALSAEMNLRPVYVVSVTRPPVNPVSKLAALQAEVLRNYQGMTADQRKTSVENQFNDLMNMDKGSRQALLGQMMDQGAVMVNAMKNMPPAQLQEFQNEMMNAMQNSGMAGAIGGLGGGKGAAGGGTGK